MHKAVIQQRPAPEWAADNPNLLPATVHPCPHCGAFSGAPCTTLAGEPKAEPHPARASRTGVELF